MIVFSRLIAMGTLVVGLPLAASAQDMAVGTVSTSGSVGQGVVISAQPLHAMGPTAVTLVAFELAGASGAWSLPPANDSGESGDSLAGDGLWSLSADMSGATPGDYELTIYVVDTQGGEFVSDPVAVTLN